MAGFHLLKQSQLLLKFCSAKISLKFKTNKDHRYGTALRTLKRFVAALSAASLAACSTSYTVDDGRKVNEKLLAQVRTYTEGEQALRPAIVKSAELHDKDCSTQWELPFETISTYAYSEDDRVAWVRASGFDEHMRVLAASPAVELRPGDIIEEIDGYDSSNAKKMTEKLVAKRDHGKPFTVKLSTGRVVPVKPLEVCRGHVALALPGKNADKQDYHWLYSQHPEEIASIHLTPDEAEWVVLFSQGVSEEGGARMKTYVYGLAAFKVAATVALTVTTAGAGVAAGNAALAAGATVSAALGRVAVAQIPGIVEKATAAATANVAALHGVSWIASTAFERADKWAFDRMPLLGADPAAGLELQTRLLGEGSVHNAFMLNKDRLAQMEALVTNLPVKAKDEVTTVTLPGVEDIAAPPVAAGVDTPQPPSPVEAGTSAGASTSEQVAEPLSISSTQTNIDTAK